MESRKLLPSLAVGSGVTFLDFLAWPSKEVKSELVHEKDAPNPINAQPLISLTRSTDKMSGQHSHGGDGCWSFGCGVVRVALPRGV